MVAHYREAAGWEGSVAHGTLGIHARLFGRRYRDPGRIADVIRCIPLFSRPVDNPATNHSGFGKAEPAQADNNADIRYRPLGTPRRPWRCAGRGWSKIKTAADARRKAHMANATSREQYRHRLDRQARAKSRAYPQAPNFAPRALGYAQDFSIRVRPNLVMLHRLHRRQLAARETKTLGKIRQTTRRTAQDKPRHPRRAALARVRRVGPSR